MIRRLTAIPAILLSLAGCRVSSPPSRTGEAGLAIPDAWAASPEARAGVDSDWVARMGSPPLTALVREAVAGNPDLKIAAARVEQAHSQIRAASAAGRPTVDFEAGGSEARRNFIGLPLPGAGDAVLKTSSESYNTVFLTEWEIDLWGRIRSGTAAAVAVSESAEQEARAARAAIAGQVARAWLALIEANQQTALAVEAIGAFEDTGKALEERFRTGQAGDQGGLGAQLRLARSDIASSRAALETRRDAQGQAARALEVLLGRYPKGENADLRELPALTAPPPAGLPSELLRRRPDILAAERRFAAQGMRQKEARRALWPSIKLTGSAGTSTAALSSLLNSGFGVWSFGARLTEPVFTAGRISAEIKRRRGEEDEALAALQKTVLRAFSEVENALASGEQLRLREAALVEATRLAGEADTEARANFRQGLGDLLTVLSTQQRAIQSRSALAAVRRLRLDNRVALHLALGGDFKVH